MIDYRDRQQASQAGLPELVGGFLPTGIHRVSWSEFRVCFGTNPVRLRHLDNFSEACRILAGFGCRAVYVGGSFVSGKAEPGDFDACWDEDSVDVLQLRQTHPMFFSTEHPTVKRFGGNLWGATDDVWVGTETGFAGCAFEFLQISPRNPPSYRVGLVLLDPRELSD